VNAAPDALIARMIAQVRVVTGYQAQVAA